MDSNLCSLASVSGKGMGVVAQGNIPAGSLICMDYPLIVVDGASLGFTDICKKSTNADIQLHYKKTLPFVLEQFNALSDQQKNEVSDLYDANADDDARALKEALVKGLLKDQQDLTFDQIYKSSPEMMSDRKSVAGIWETNCIPQGDHNAQGLYPMISRFNHSCVPNAIYHWREDLGTNVVIVTKALTGGEEICVPYFKSLFMNSGERNKRTMISWGFQCKCKACSIVPPELKELQNQMKSMSDEELDAIPEATFAFFEKAGLSNMRRQNLWRLEQSMEMARSRQHALEMLQEMRRAFLDEDLLPNLQIEAKLAFDLLNLEVIYGKLADAKSATADLCRIAEELYGSQDELTIKYKSWRDSKRGAPTPEQLCGKAQDPSELLASVLDRMRG